MQGSIAECRSLPRALTPFLPNCFLGSAHPQFSAALAEKCSRPQSQPRVHRGGRYTQQFSSALLFLLPVQITFRIHRPLSLRGGGSNSAKVSQDSRKPREVSKKRSRSRSLSLQVRPRWRRHSPSAIRSKALPSKRAATGEAVRLPKRALSPDRLGLAFLQRRVREQRRKLGRRAATAAATPTPGHCHRACVRR